ncbi:DNA-formamidopyrimidine glycosylase family protein [Thiosocius teredinicola]|uniref:DNA-formamidopyrimidine glycosylase family protein n=1 Tax=Thiosocius teredinicola TaxID=1973002 RepID=UPI000990D2C6
MPEGDTIFKLAAYLKPVLTDQRIQVGTLRDQPAVDLAGREITDVFAHGKHLFIAFDDEHMLRSHLGMWGSWHHYAIDETWQKPARQASIVLELGQRVYVCFNAQQVELMRKHGVRARQFGIVMGPDLLADEVDIDDIVTRAREMSAPSRPIADVLLDQRIASGIGNVYKSEVLFIECCQPASELQQLDHAVLRNLYQRASELLNENTRGGPRITRRANDQADTLWVYGRTGLPCLRCDTPIESMRFGKAQRSTFWCPHCQPTAA